MKFSFVIVTYNSSDLIKDCIDSIYKHLDIDTSDIEIIIIDNSDESEHKKISEIMQRIYSYKDNLFLYKNENRGYGQGNNVGIQKSTGDIVCIMNPDVRFSEPLLKCVKDEFYNDNLLALYGFKQKNKAGITFYFKPEYYYSIITHILIRFLNKFDFFHPKFCYLSGALMFIDKNKITISGLFDERMFLFFEEPDILNRLQKNNYQIKYNKTKSYIHLDISRKVFNKLRFESTINSLYIYSQKYNIDLKLYYKKKIIDLLFSMLFLKMKWEKDAINKIKKEIIEYKKLIAELKQ